MSVRVLHGDNRDLLKGLGDASIDSVVTDPPYALVSIAKRFGKDGAAAAKSNGATGVYARASAGFMGQKWDTGETAFAVEFWAEVFRVLKPGAHVLAFSGTRTYHRMACAIEDAGFEVRDQLAWLFGSGFPKSHNQQGEWGGWGTALKPAWEPICLARKPLIGSVAENVLEHGTGALNIDGCRIHAEDAQGGEYRVKRCKPGATLDKTGGTWKPEEGGVEFVGNMKPGRWPANIVHDGSDEVLAAFPNTASGGGPTAGDRNGEVYGQFAERSLTNHGPSEGSAARFFYAAKAGRYDRFASKHPTVKPVDLMRWLVRLVTPPGGTVLDPFAGTGTTGAAAMAEGFDSILMEREAAYVADIDRRIAWLKGDGPLTAQALAKGQDTDPGPLFSGEAA
jgi:site-specific DNA-methyltransferase (adenine-specific)